MNPSVSVSTPALTSTTVGGAAGGGTSADSGGSGGGSGGSTAGEGSGTVSASQVAQICATSGSDGSCSSTRFIAMRDGTVAQPAAQVQLSEKQQLW